jgi:hypothetical protein
VFCIAQIEVGPVAVGTGSFSAISSAGVALAMAGMALIAAGLTVWWYRRFYSERDDLAGESSAPGTGSSATSLDGVSGGFGSGVSEPGSSEPGKDEVGRDEPDGGETSAQGPATGSTGSATGPEIDLHLIGDDCRRSRVRQLVRTPRPQLPGLDPS